jgi:hypothetical protein
MKTAGVDLVVEDVDTDNTAENTPKKIEGLSLMEYDFDQKMSDELSSCQELEFEGWLSNDRFNPKQAPSKEELMAESKWISKMMARKLQTKFGERARAFHCFVERILVDLVVKKRNVGNAKSRCSR